ncbi:MAG: tRNA pseudouridine(38-40) synthase TruA [Ignavibacteriales bacterium]
MARFKIYLEYDGTRYSGWQMQKQSKTIQGTLLTVAEQIFKGENADIQGSGRTDSGVHAICQVAHLEVKTMLAPEIIRMKFNDKLPYDINIIEVEKIHHKFHARHDAVSRSYIYQISKRRTAFGKPYVWWIKDKLQFSNMQKASRLFVGMKDYQSFSDDDKLEKSTKVLLESIQLKEHGDLILIRIQGSHFLWKMVRRMVGVLVEVGRGNLSEKDILRYLQNKSEEPAKYTAPPSGLFLEQVIYEGEEFRQVLNPVTGFNIQF